MTIAMYTRIAVQCLKTGLQNVDEEQGVDNYTVCDGTTAARHYKQVLSPLLAATDSVLLHAECSHLVCVFVSTR